MRGFAGGLLDIKNIINKYPKINIDKIQRKIDRSQVVSFDIFDTLIKRDVQSEHDVFDLAERLFNQRHEESIYGYRALRKQAEEKARTNADSEEITLEQLRNALIGEKDRNGLAINDSIAAELIGCEREIERRVCMRNENLYPIYKYCVQVKKCIIITSDMYWERGFLEELLKNSGYEGYDSVYVSSEFGKQKKSGGLYRILVGQTGVSPRGILHIGDNKKSDFLSAKNAGLKAISIPKIIDNTFYARKVKDASLEWKCYEKFTSNRLMAIENLNERIGYEVYGPLLYSFVKWLSVKLDSSKTTLFFARDCYVVKQAFELYTNRQSDKNIYFLGSRRSLMIPALRNGSDLDRVSALIKSEARKMTISGLLKKLGVDGRQYADRLKSFDLSGDTIVDRDNLRGNEHFVSFYESIKADIQTNAEAEYTAFTKYWNSLNCTHKIQIVDIGWRGTMQYCLENLIGDNYDIKGYYLGIRKDAIIDNYEDIFLNGRENFEKECFLAGMTALIEIFFSAAHGSIKRYSDEGQVEYLPYECENDPESQEFVRDLQEGALRFVEDYKRCILSELVPIQSKSMFNTLFKMGAEPQKKELRSFGSYPFQTGAGVKKNIDTKGILKYSVSQKSFLYDFSNSNWKVGFLKETMKIKMPYYALFKLIYKHRG